jgi:type III secretory pathway component EscR
MPFCPERTLTDLPKELIIEMIKEMYYNNQLAPFSDHYEKYIDRFEKHFFENNTTKAMAKKFINIMNIL